MSLSDGRMTVVLFFSICFVLLGNGFAQKRPAEPNFLSESSSLLELPKKEQSEAHEDEGSLHIFSTNTLLAPGDLRTKLGQLRDAIYVVPLGNPKTGVINMAAPSLTGDHRLVNSYLEGYYPYFVDNPMIPLYVLSKRKQYQLDADQYRGREEVWQTSREAFSFSRGDCEDHALILADWLIGIGEDARVVLGDYRGGGHAWVVLFKGGKEFLLEATKKDGVGRNRAYPLASLHNEYHPQIMFNRSEFWENSGSKYTTRYSGRSWRLQSRYHRESLDSSPNSI
tara:strand:- start:43 stop:888 length:846 start_codon:yes stop_codon:yes gene_type:complete